MNMPSSLSWLVGDWARCMGSIERRQRRLTHLQERLQHHLDFVKNYSDQVEQEQRALASASRRASNLEVAIGLHETYIDLTSIPAVGPPRNRSIAPFGVMTSVIYRTIRTAPNQVAWTSEIAKAFAKVVGGQHGFDQIRYRVQVRLCILERAGRLRSLSKKGAPDRQWGFPEHVTTGPSD